MLQRNDYLKISRRNQQCARCGKSLLEEDRHPSILVEPQGAPATELASENPPETEDAALEPEPASDEQADRPPDDAPAQASQEDDEGFQRLDYCAECWRQIKEQAYFSFWIGRPRDQDQPKRKLNKVERNLALAALFDSLSDRQNEAGEDYAPHLFFLAHLLMKFRIFKWKPAVDDPESGQSMLRFDRTDCDEEVRITDMDMPAEMVLKVKEEVEAYLKESTGQDVPL